MKQKEMIQKMTMEEKAAILSGKNVWQTWNIDRLGIPSIFCSDGPHGIRKQAGEGDHLGLNESVPSTCFPTAAAVANSWDEGLAEEIGRALGEEASSLDVNVLLGPGLNIKRSPLCGRNFEYFSEDPYLSGKMAASYVNGIQSQGVFACPKHFAVNSQEQLRMSVNSVLDERTLREIYLEGFEIAVKEGGAKSIMSSYNAVNGEYANENEHLLKEILREEWGFDGIVITDWGGSNDHVKGVSAGSNLEMPSPGLGSAREVIAAVKEGSLSMEELDARVDELLDGILTLSKNQKRDKKVFDQDAHHKLAGKAAQESIVLLKNKEELLPLNSGCKVALIGDFAFIPRYQGAGSSVVNPIALETMETKIQETSLNLVGCARGYLRNGKTDASLKEEALLLAAKADVVLYCFGLDELSESEGQDRSHLKIPSNQIELLKALAGVNSNLVGILSAGSVIEMPWHSACSSILHGYLGGQAGAGAMLRVITGEVNPSGRLGETYPIALKDTPAFRYFPGNDRNAEYREGIYVGYRYYDTAKVVVQYPFGYGLSYTTFAYSDLQLSKEGVTFTLTNKGGRDGKEVAQLYVTGPKGTIFRPEKELKGFAKIHLKAGESKTVKIPFDDKAFRYWNIETNGWEEEGGNYTISIGASVADLRLSMSLNRKGTTDQMPYQSNQLNSYESGQIGNVSTEEFERLLGQPVPDGSWSGVLGLNDAICQMYYAKSRLARLIYRILTKLKKASEAKGKPDLNLLFIYNMPFRGIAKMTGGAVSMEMAKGMVQVVNGRFRKGMKKIIGGYFSNAKANKAYEKKLSDK
ncbi:glycoside hydrolase family 3 C-terminal domain-containing protein [Clostridium sp. E02]|uniref:glycoside hydrolase family 3 C-terminal domain-containing protein n=1 Tax=Clostridium sp. E02 TaxID=2487134 RepID=UPI000F5220DF|nr:glycoside hydrolase family 3 C-terminal domain-containing protein [Clostridium sp. E02]